MFEELGVDFSGTFGSDIEANGLLEKVSKVWCIVSICIKTNRIFVFHDNPEFDNTVVTDPETQEQFTIPPRTGSLTDGARFWWMIGKNGGKLSVHNALGYDKFVIDKFWPKCKIPVDTWWDTLIQSKVQWFDRDIPKGAKGQHGLQAYGCRFGVMKPEVNDWSFFDAWKLHRCIEDCKIQVLTHKYLQKERALVKEKLGIDFSEALEMEHKFRLNATKQELNGALVDKAHMESCVEELSVILEDLKNEIEPNLPKMTKPKSTKISRSEIAELLGFSARDTYTVVDGQDTVDKPYYKPTTNFTKKEKSVTYSAKHPKLGITTPDFDKKKDLSDYIKDLYPETKIKDWDINKKEEIKELLNANTCAYFEVAPEQTDIISGPFTKVEFLDSSLSQGEVVKKYLISLGWKSADEWTLKKNKEGQVERAKTQMVVSWPEKPLYGDPKNVITKVIKKGQPIVVSPKLTDDCFEQLPDGIGKKISDYNTYGHRLRFLKNPEDDTKGLLNNIRPDGRITCGVNNFNTSTGRSSQSLFVNCPSESALYGEKLRGSLVAGEGNILVGADMRSCQLALAAYYSNNFDYYMAVATGNEFKLNEDGSEMLHPVSGKPWYIGESGHCVSARAFGLVTEEEWKTAVEKQNQELIHKLHLVRKYGKAASFGTIFGCSGKKLAGMLHVAESLGDQKRQMYLDKVGLGRVIEILERMCISNERCGGGYIELPFGYHVWTKMPHKRVNYLIQGSEAVCQKWAINYFEEVATSKGYKYKKILDMHDEMLVEASEDCAEQIGNLMGEAYTLAAYELKEWHRKKSKWFCDNDLPSFCIDLSSGFKMGKSYASCH